MDAAGVDCGHGWWSKAAEVLVLAAVHAPFVVVVVVLWGVHFVVVVVAVASKLNAQPFLCV